jgi:cytoskeleton protein RodZ
MQEIGKTLREARERLGLSLEEVERATRIRAHHLLALEAGDLEALPSPVQARGFLKNYAEFLGLDVDAILLRYAETLQSRRTRFRRAEALAVPPGQPAVQIRSRRPRWLSADLFVAGAITLVVLVVLIWGLGRVMAVLRERTLAAGSETALLNPTATSSATATEVLLEVPTSSEVVIVQPLSTPPSPTPLPPFAVQSSGVDLRLVVEQSAWIRVLVDGQESFRGRVTPGQLLEYVGQQVVEVTTGNAAGLRVFYNGQDQGTLGALGEVVIRLWTTEGVLTPTPTLTHTPTVTPRITNTPRPTATSPATPGV